jgi:hypothetical protein
MSNSPKREKMVVITRDGVITIHREFGRVRLKFHYILAGKTK